MSEENKSPASPTNLESSDVPNIPVLEAFIFKSDEYSNEIVPRLLSPLDVAKFLSGRIEKDTKLKAFFQVEKAANFYDTNEIVGKFKKFLDRSESNEDEVLRSIVVARIIGRLGDSEDVEFARQYYKYLIQKVNSEKEFIEIIYLHEALDLGENSNALKQKIQDKTDELKSKKDTNYEAELKYLNFEETILSLLEQAEKVQQIKSKILNTPERKKRIYEEIKAYLTIEYGFVTFLQPWAARRIRQETWAEKPSEQRFRNDRQPLKKEVAIAFRDFLGELDKFTSLQKEEKEAIRIRILRAIKFFDGKISEEEEDFLKLNKEEQADTLANEGFMLPKQ
jgi:hypothetical protein